MTEQKQVPGDHPALSVVLVLGDVGTRRGLENALNSLLHQKMIDEMEVLVMDCSAPGSPPLTGSDHACVRTIKLARETTTIALARVEGIHRARAPIVAFLDDHSAAMAGWAEALVEAHEGPWAGVGGEIYNMSSASGFADPIYLMGHGRWAPPARRGQVDLLVAHDTAYKRDILLGYGEELSDLLLAEPILMWKLREDGHKLFLEPKIKSLHGYTVNPFTLVAFFAWNRCFSHMRARFFKWTRWKRLLRISGAVIIPWVRVAGLGFRLLRKHPVRLPTFFVGIPIILLAQYGAAAGEAVGLLWGKGKADVLFTRCHLREPPWRAF